MNDPLELAIRKISETRNLLELVVKSSESFDYPKAKTALRELQVKIKELGRLQSEFQNEWRPVATEGVIAFPRTD